MEDQKQGKRVWVVYISEFLAEVGSKVLDFERSRFKEVVSGGPTRKFPVGWTRLLLVKRRKKKTKKKILTPTSSGRGRHLLLTVLEGKHLLLAIL